MGIDPGTKLDMEIIGVVKDIKYTTLRDDIPEQAFEPYLAETYTSGMTVYVRTTLDPNQLFSAIRAKVRSLDPAVPIYDMRTTEEQIGNSLSTERLIASLSAVFGFLATLLATIGLYGVMAYTVARRTREIGIRMALGAVQSKVVWMVMKEVLILVGLGVGIGVPAALTCVAAPAAQLTSNAAPSTAETTRASLIHPPSVGTDVWGKTSRRRLSHASSSDERALRASSTAGTFQSESGYEAPKVPLSEKISRS